MKSDVGPFTIMPEWVMRSGVSNSAIAVYAALGLHADKDTGEAWPSRERIAGLVGLSTRQVSNLLRELEAAGAVQTDLESRQGSSNAYRIVFAQPLNSVARGVEPDFKAPLETDFNQNQNHLEPESGTSLAPTSSARKRDEVWDVLVQIYGEPTASGKGSMNAAAKTLRDYGALPAEIAWMAGVLGRTDLGWAVVTPTALAKYFGERQALVAQLDKKPFDRAAAIANGSADG